MFRRAASVFGGDTRNDSGRFADPTQINPAPSMQPTTAMQPSQPYQAQTPGATGNDTLTDDFRTITDGLWDDTPKNKDGNAGGNGSGGTNQNNNNQGGDQPKPRSFEDHLNELQFHKIPQLNPAELAKIQTGDFSPIMDRMSQMSKGLYQQAVSDAFKMLQERAPQLVNEAVNKADTTRHTEQYVQQLHDKLPFTKDPAIAPIAKSVFSRFLKRGDGLEGAVENTRKYFAGMSERAMGGGNQNRDDGRSQEVTNWAEWMGAGV